MVVCSSEIVVHRLKQLETIDSGAAGLLPRFWQFLVAPSFSEAPHLRNSRQYLTQHPNFGEKMRATPDSKFQSSMGTISNDNKNTIK